jgi:hypothetical protein
MLDTYIHQNKKINAVDFKIPSIEKQKPPTYFGLKSGSIEGLRFLKR